MSAKKTKGSRKAPLKLPKKKSNVPRMQAFDGNLLEGKYDIDHLKRNGLYNKTVRRKARYWCYKMHHAVVEERKTKPKGPKGFYDFVEGLPGFAGWEYFARTWDLHGENPFMIVLRLSSVWQDWDYVMERVAIPVDAPPEQINARMEQLAREYAKNNK